MPRISSPQNPVIKYVRTLERPRARREQGVYLAEGVRLMHEALSTDQSATIVLYDPDQLTRPASGSSLLAAIPRWAHAWYEVDARVLRAAAQTETPGGVLAVLRAPDPPPLDSLVETGFGLILDQLADPGNAGTILRTADAAGVGYVITSADSVDLFAPKVVRAGMGAHFRLPLCPALSWEDIGRVLRHVPLVVTDVEGGESIYDYRWPQRAALVIGSEARGISSEARERASARVRIPMRRGVESLNAAVAASLTIYAALGPRLAGGGVD